LINLMGGNQSAERERDAAQEALRRISKLHEEVEAELRREKEARMTEETLERKVDELRSLVAGYQLGSFSELDKVRNIDLSDISCIRIALLGPMGSGKGSFGNTCERALKLSTRGNFVLQSAGNEGTIHVEQNLDGYNFNLVDTRGLFKYDKSELKAFFDVVDGNISPGEEIQFEGGDNIPDINAPLAERIHAVICVVNAKDPRLHDTYLNLMKNPREALRKRGIAPITIATHADLLRTDDEKENALKVASMATGSASNATFLITNYIEDGCDRNFLLEHAVLTVLEYALSSGERYIKLYKQRQAAQNRRNQNQNQQNQNRNQNQQNQNESQNQTPNPGV